MENVLYTITQIGFVDSDEEMTEQQIAKATEEVRYWWTNRDVEVPAGEDVVDFLFCEVDYDTSPSVPENFCLDFVEYGAA